MTFTSEFYPRVNPKSYKCFGLMAVDEQKNEYCIYGAPVEQWLSNFSLLWKSNLRELFEIVSAYLTNRFPNTNNLTLSEIMIRVSKQNYRIYRIGANVYCIT